MLLPSKEWFGWWVGERVSRLGKRAWPAWLQRSGGRERRTVPAPRTQGHWGTFSHHHGERPAQCGRSAANQARDRRTSGAEWHPVWRGERKLRASYCVSLSCTAIRYYGTLRIGQEPSCENWFGFLITLFLIFVVSSLIVHFICF